MSLMFHHASHVTLSHSLIPPTVHLSPFHLMLLYPIHLYHPRCTMLLTSHLSQAHPICIIHKIPSLPGTSRWAFNRKNLKFISTLGAGAYGEVCKYSAKHIYAERGEDAMLVAVKTCKEESNIPRFTLEINIMKVLGTPCLPFP